MLVSTVCIQCQTVAQKFNSGYKIHRLSNNKNGRGLIVFARSICDNFKQIISNKDQINQFVTKG